jgi:hypothetical protein
VAVEVLDVAPDAQVAALVKAAAIEAEDLVAVLGDGDEAALDFLFDGMGMGLWGNEEEDTK